jgi:hypothetical protein
MGQPPVFSPDSKRVAYGVRAGKGWFAVVDGVEGKPYEAMGVYPVFSPNSTHVAYGANVGSKWFVVLDGVEGAEYDDVVAMGGGRIVFDSENRYHHLALKGDDIYLVEVSMQ